MYLVDRGGDALCRPSDKNIVPEEAIDLYSNGKSSR